MRVPVRFAGRDRGFGLVEFTVVLAIIAILAAMSMTSARYLRDRARMGIYYGYVHDIKQAAIAFKQDMGYFPPYVGKGCDPSLITRGGHLCPEGRSSSWDNVDLTNWHGPYLPYKRWPRNPWGGYLRWDYLPEGAPYGGVDAPGIYLTSVAGDSGGRDGLPAATFEERLQATSVDKNTIAGIISLYLGEANATVPAAPAK